MIGIGCNSCAIAVCADRTAVSFHVLADYGGFCPLNRAWYCRHSAERESGPSNAPAFIEILTQKRQPPC